MPTSQSQQTHRKGPTVSNWMRRSAKPLGILAGFCIVMVGVFYFMKAMGWTKLGEEDRLVSATRRVADDNFKNRRWKRAADGYRQMLLDDPYNPSAHFRLAYAMHRQFLSYQQAEPGSGNDNLSKKRESFDQAVASYQDATEYPGFSHYAQYNLACLYALNGNRDKAIEYLTQFIHGDFLTTDGISKEKDFESLLADPDFIVLAQREKRTRRGGNYNGARKIR